jgi:hypothetical protein
MPLFQKRMQCDQQIQVNVGDERPVPVNQRGSFNQGTLRGR